MTIKEKNDVIQKYCGDCEDCSRCVIVEECNSCDGGFDQTWNQELCEKAYAILTSGGIPNESTEVESDVVNHPSHYTHGGMECIDEMILIFGEQAVMNFCLCNAWKYRKRAIYKNGEEDMKKSDAYLRCYKSLREYGIAKFES